MVTESAIVDLVSAGETGHVEFKRARCGMPEDFWPTYSAFANTDGGTVVLGVSENSTGKMQSTEKSTEESTEESTDTEERIWALMRANKHITQGMISEKLGITRNYVAKLAMSLTARHKIRRIGPDRGGVWEVLD